MSVHTKNFLIGVVVSAVIFGCSYFIHGPDLIRLFITTGVGVLTAMLTGYLLYKDR